MFAEQIRAEEEGEAANIPCMAEILLSQLCNELSQ